MQAVARAFLAPRSSGPSAGSTHMRCVRTRSRWRDYHIAMIGAAICVLIIACANVAALMLARGMVRTRDYAVRLALGANRIEVAREVIVEVAVLALASCVAGASRRPR